MASLRSKLPLLAALIAVALPSVATAMVEEAADPVLPLQQRINEASAGDIVIVEGGEYHERIVIDKPVVLIGKNSPVIDGDGGGTVVTIAAPDVVVSGFAVRNSGHTISQEPAAIKIDQVDRVSIRNNRITDSHFGIYVLGSTQSSIVENTVDLGDDLSVARRGHGVYFWQVTRTVVHGNTIRSAADGIHLEFSDDNGVGSNTVTDSRYALHFMSSDGNRILENTFRDNLAGAVLMFSHDLLLKDNELSSNRKGATGAGILLKDCDNVYAEGNRVLRNKVGMTVEGTPQAVGATAIFRENLFALNDTGLALMSNAPITFAGNALVENTVQVRALGRGAALGLLSSHDGGSHESAAPKPEVAQPPKGAVWTIDGKGNYWSDYRGYDADGNGAGDTPYRPLPPFAGRLDSNEALRLFQFTLAQQAIDVAADMFPIYRYDPVLEDSGPLMKPPPGLSLSASNEVNLGLLAVSGGMIVSTMWAAASVLGLSGGEVALRVRVLLSRRRAGGGAAA